MSVEGGGDLVGCVSAVPSDLDSNDYYALIQRQNPNIVSVELKFWCQPSKKILVLTNAFYVIAIIYILRFSVGRSCT